MLRESIQHSAVAPAEPSDGTPASITATPIDIRWTPDLPVFAKPEFLKGVGSSYGWLGGFDEAGTQRCILPYTIVRKVGLSLVRFRVETVPCGLGLSLLEEKSFLNGVVRYFRISGADIIIPASNNALFRTYPDGAKAAPYGSYVIDLQHPEDMLWRNVSKTTRQNIQSAQKDGVLVHEKMELLDEAYEQIRETFRRSKMGFMSHDSFMRFASSLGGNCKLLVAEHKGVAQSYSLFAFSEASAYWIYGGNIASQHPGAMKLLQWEAIRLFRDMGVRKYDFYGARIDPPKGSKQEGINKMKKLLGGTLARGYLWKYGLRPVGSWLYANSVRMLRGGDIVDQEEHKLSNIAAESQTPHKA